MRKLYIADDEPAIREGIKYIVDWQELGYEIIGEAGNGTKTLAEITALNPDLVLIDVRMPGMLGLDVIENAVARGFSGHFIILSGYSDFQYARQAMRSGVSHYLTKPLNEEELIDAVNEINAEIEKSESQSSIETFLMQKSRKEILSDIVLGKTEADSADSPAFNVLKPDSKVYQIIIYENFDMEVSDIPYQFSELFRSASPDSAESDSFDHFTAAGHDALLLRGIPAIERFKRFLNHYEQHPQKGSPLDSVFIAYGNEVSELKDIRESFNQALTLIERRFFCNEGQHVIGYSELPSIEKVQNPNDNLSLSAKHYSTELTGLIQAFNKRKVNEVLSLLKENLQKSHSSSLSVKYFLIDLFLQIKDSLSHTYSSTVLPFESNSYIIEFVNSQHFLYNITAFFSAQFEMIMSAIGGSSRESVLDDILYYIEHNYHQNIKLETIAALFGYNPSYLGKIFTKNVGESFNSYVDQVRIKKAIELISQNELKVYEIADKVGYKNVDYFHKKFKKYTECSPAEYRKKIGIE